MRTSSLFGILTTASKACAALTLLVFISACNAPKGSDPVAAAIAESAYSATPVAITNGFTVKASAKFFTRTLVFNASSPYASSSGLRGISAGTGIPFCEFHIFNSSGTQVQQGETDGSGVMTFDVPRTAGTYSIHVYSRAFNSRIKVSVLQDNTSNSPYDISGSFTLTSAQVADMAQGTVGAPYDVTATPVRAEADETISAKIEGGAFNILNNIYLVNEYIRNEIGKNDAAHTTDTQKWWVADKVVSYWKAGFNPATYFNSSTLLSFYVPGTSKLYILGGSSGNVKTSDTDHFDDSVIIHEYGHFLEDTQGKTQSPGGSHNGNFIIDPRLSWSEGWADYLQAAVLTNSSSVGSSNNKFYVDTIGYKSSAGDGGTGIAIAIDLTEQGTSATYDNVNNDIAGGGSFREISISRTLYKTTRGASTSLGYSGSGCGTLSAFACGGGIPFSLVWRSFSGDDGPTGNATKDTPVANSLRSSSVNPLTWSGILNYYVQQNAAIVTPAVSLTKWNTLISEEKQSVGSANYGAILSSPTTTPCSAVLGPGTPDTTFGGLYRSDQTRNNDFFVYYHTGLVSSMSLKYANNAATQMDADLYMYNYPYSYFEDYTRLTGGSSSYVTQSSARFPASAGGSDSGTETINLSSLPAGMYLVVVKFNSFKQSGALKLTSEMNGNVTYHLEDQTGKYLCPQ